MLRSVFENRPNYKPFDRPYYHEAWKKQLKAFWLFTEIDMKNDTKEFYAKDGVTEDERQIIIRVLSIFAQSDVEVSKYYLKLLEKIKLYEVVECITAFAAMETIHAGAYAYLVDELQIDQAVFEDPVKIKDLLNKYEFLSSCNVNSTLECLNALGKFSALIEGCILFSSFCILNNLSRFGLLRGLGQIATLSMHDENLHCETMSQLYKDIKEDYLNPQFLDATINKLELEMGDNIIHVEKDTIKIKINKPRLRKNIEKTELDIFQTFIKVLNIEFDFIDYVFQKQENGKYQLSMRGLTPEELKTYVTQLGIQRLKDIDINVDKLQSETNTIFQYNDKQNYPKWVDKFNNLKTHVDFFAMRPTAYQKPEDSWPETL